MDKEQLIKILKTKKDIISEEHDGVYILVPKVVEELSKIDLNSLDLDYTYLDAIYFLCIGTWISSFDNKIKRINESNLPNETKNNIIKFIQEEKEKTEKGKYSKNTLGMFGTPKMTFNMKPIPEKEQIIKFFKLIIDIKNADDNLENIINIMQSSQFKMAGLKKGMLSQFLHCIKPNIFPIVNSRGRDIYDSLEVKIDKNKKEISDYITDIKNINEFIKQNKFKFKNYRVIDLLDTDINVYVIKQKKQIILQGAPGTGKTYSSSEIAVKLIDGNAPSDRAELMKRYKELVDKEQIFFTTFHQSMDYEEFVEGIKPNTLNDNIIYELEDGIFKKACYSTKTAGLNKTSIEKAWNEFKEDLISKEIRFDSNNNNIGKITLKTKTNIDFYLTTDKNDNVKYKPSTQNPNNEEWRHIRASLFGLYNKTYESALSYTEPLLQYLKVNYNLSDAIENNKSPVVLIIDEINRGNISKIFGELITLLEVDKRKGKENEIEVILPYSKEKFSVPDNLYIIGTMNTADRSIGYIDYALRRRFAFISIKADKLAIENYYDNKNSDCKDKAINLFDEIKNLIDKNINEEFEVDDIMIGHSYFMAQNFEELQNKLEYEIKPLLLEYFKDGILKSNKDLKDTINNLNYE